MDLEIKDRVAIITGASQGIGESIAKTLSKEGVSVVITSNDEENLLKVGKHIRDLGGKCLEIVADVRNHDEIEHVVNHTFNRLGKINILVNNVGIPGRIAEFEKLSIDEWLEMFELNLFSGVNYTKKTLPIMKRQRWGRIIFIGSQFSAEPCSEVSHYSASKAAVTSLTKSLANTVGKHGITVNSIAPSCMPTAMHDPIAQMLGITREQLMKEINNKLSVMPDGLIGKPIDVAHMICFLCSEKAGWITGGNFRVDGGSIKTLQT